MTEVMEVISREEAKAQGLRRYFTGEPCRQGHLSERYVIGKRCVECDRESNRKSRQAAPVAPAQPSTQPQAAPSQGGKGGKRERKQRVKVVLLGELVQEPTPWAWDGGKRREPVLDHDHTPPLVVRQVGWRVCMRCSTPFWSTDAIRVRMCDNCKQRREL
tara:strand:- start:254800 stop:255279 length:480 start_codon:yes stop_codon:yes gene_type:complete